MVGFAVHTREHGVSLVFGDVKDRIILYFYTNDARVAAEFGLVDVGLDSGR